MVTPGEKGRIVALPSAAKGARVTGVSAVAGDRQQGLSGCVGAPTGVLVSGESGLDDAAWLTADGSTFDRVRLGAGGDDVGPVRAVPGGLAAAGTLASKRRSGAALWLSADGKTWRGLAVPGGAASEGSDVAVDGEDLVVTGASGTGPRAWRLADYREQVREA